MLDDAVLLALLAIPKCTAWLGPELSCHALSLQCHCSLEASVTVAACTASALANVSTSEVRMMGRYMLPSQQHMYMEPHHVKVRCS